MTHKPHIIVLGNEKGGTGKSTVSMHLVVSLLRMGFSVGSIDVDARQGTLTRYMDHRKATAQRVPLLISEHISVLPSQDKSKEEAAKEDQQNLEDALARLSSNQFILIDTPGNDTPLSRAAHAVADTLVTPLNDSFVDLDVLAHVHGETLEMTEPSTYANMVWDQKKQRAIRDRGSVDWIILRNRLSGTRAKNKQKMEKVMQLLSKRLGFRFVAGFGERVIFRELFLSGITVLDLQDCKIPMTLSHVAAKQELRNLIHHMNLPQLEKLVA